MAPLLTFLKKPSCIYCTYLWLTVLAMVNAQEVLQPNPDELQLLNRDTRGLNLSADEGNNKHPAFESQPIEVAALGRPLFPGMLYDCRKDTFIPGVTLWDKKSLTEDLDTRLKPMTDLKFSSSDSLSSKSSLLDVSASLKASFSAGLVEVEGSAKFLRDTKSSNQQSRVTMYYSETTRFEQLTMTQLGQITYPQVFDQKTATHVVTGVLYGAHAAMVFDRTFSEEEEKQEIEGKLNVMVKKIPEFSIEGHGAVNMTDTQRHAAESIACTFYGDFRLDQSPTTYTEAIAVYKKLPTILKKNPLNAVPVKVWLYPLSLLDDKAARLERELSTRLVSNTEDIIEELGGVERTCNDLSSKTLVNVFKDTKERLLSFQGSLNIYKMVFLKAVAKVLPAIRGGEKEQNSLEVILKIHYSSPFTADMLNQWLDHAKAELNILSFQTEILKGIITEDSNRLNIDRLDPDIDVVVCLTFTSLKYEDPHLSAMKKFLESEEFKKLDEGMKLQSNTSAPEQWLSYPDVILKMRENLSLFRSFSEANKDEERYRFIISAISDPSSPGSSIYLYVKGKLTDTQFQPVSKPPPPVVKKVLERSVLLKLQKSPTGETVQFRVEYQQVKADSGAEEHWFTINTADADFTLPGLEFGKQYLIRYRIVGKVGVSEASDTIGPIQSSDVPQTRSEFLQYSRQFTLDPNTAHKRLHLSEGNRVITKTGTYQWYPDHPDRFDHWEQVLCREGVSGRSYWEIEWSGIDVSLSVAYKSISRKGSGNECAFGYNDQSWSLYCSSSGYAFIEKSKVSNLLVPSSRRVGVYVDHSAGTLSFYSISDTMILIQTVQTTFTQPLYPGFRLYTGSVKLR